MTTNQFICFIERSLGLSDCRFALLPARLCYLVQLLVQVRLDELELGLVAAEELRAGIGVQGVRHLDDLGCLGT